MPNKILKFELIEGLYEMYKYDEDYEFRYWVQKVKIKAEMI